MTRTSFAIAIALTLVASASFAQGNTITTHKVVGNIYMLEGQGGNIGVSIGDDGVLIIDDQFERMSDAIKKAIGDLHSGPLRYVLNTHHHGDHTGGNIVFGREAPIVAHTNVRSRMAKGKNVAAESLPIITYDDSVSIHFNGEEIKLVHFPHGHTDSDSVVFFTGSNVVHMGDHFFNGSFPFIDTGGGGDVEQYIKNVRAVLADLPGDVHIIPGHGPLATKKDLQTFVDTVSESIEIIRKGVEAGKSAKDIIDEGLPDKFDGWGAGFVSANRWIGIVHGSLSN